MTTYLIDIGGTYLRTARAGPNGPEEISQYPLSDYTSLEQALTASISPGSSKLYIACAGEPGKDGKWHMPNGPAWKIDRQALEDAGYSIATFVNDFEAAGYAVPALESTDLTSVYAPPSSSTPANSNLALIGPGTGLGLCFICPGDSLRTPQGAPQVFPTCGAHMLAGSLTKEHHEIVQRIGKLLDRPAVYENICSGTGLLLLYEAVTGRPCESAEKALEDEEICRYFHEFLGLFIHHAMIFTNSYGGIYLNGGVLHGLVKDNRFSPELMLSCVHLEGIPLMNDYIRSAPVYMIKDYHITLKGLYERALLNH